MVAEELTIDYRTYGADKWGPSAPTVRQCPGKRISEVRFNFRYFAFVPQCA
jgi:hypothetical protein